MKSICSIIIIKCNVTQSISNTLRNEMGDINEVDRNVTLSSRSRIDRPYFLAISPLRWCSWVIATPLHRTGISGRELYTCGV